MSQDVRSLIILRLKKKKPNIIHPSNALYSRSLIIRYVSTQTLHLFDVPKYIWCSIKWLIDHYAGTGGGTEDEYVSINALVLQFMQLQLTELARSH